MTVPPPLLSVAEARDLIAQSVARAAPVVLPLEAVLGRVLAESVFAPVDQPALDQSSIDGYAVAEGSLAGCFQLAGECLPGCAPSSSAPEAGEAWRIFTGTPLPAGCALVMREDADVAADGVRLQVPARTDLIRRRGGAVRAGDLLLEAGTCLTAGEIALLASIGQSRPLVHPAPRVLHLTTGSEIVPAGAEAQPWQIRDSNSPLLAAMLQQAGLLIPLHRHVDESVAAFVAAVTAAGDSDCLLVSGGSSVGQHDNTARALQALGFATVFHRVNARPGKPLLFARRGRQMAFGIPGNPVAHFAVFHTFILSALRRFSGLPERARVQARLSEFTVASVDPRETLWPATLRMADDGWRVQPRPWVHSGDIAALRTINALIHFPGATAMEAGKRVDVFPCFDPV